MNKTENLIKIGSAVLTPEAIKFLEYLQDENNGCLKDIRQTLLEGINSAQLMLSSDGYLPENQTEIAKKNFTNISMLYYDLEKLAKP